MSASNTKTDQEKLLPFATNMPNSPSQLLNKVNIKTYGRKRKPVKNTNRPIIKRRKAVRSGNEDKAKPVQEINSEDEKLIAQKSSNVSVVSTEKVQIPPKNHHHWNTPLSDKFNDSGVRKTLTLNDLIHNNPVANPIIKKKKANQNQEDDPDDLSPIESDEIDETSSIPNSCVTPQIKIDANGKLIIDAKTLTLNETGVEEKRKKLAKSQAIKKSAFRVQPKKKKNRTIAKRWKANETIKFYRCLMKLGTDFSLIQQYFPDRTRAQIKRKFKFEEKHNGQLISDTAFPNKNLSDTIDTMVIEDQEPKSANETNARANLEINTRDKHCQRQYKNARRADYRRTRILGNALENESDLVKKEKSTRPSCMRTTAISLKDMFIALKGIQVKKNNSIPLSTKIHAVEKTLPKLNGCNVDTMFQERDLHNFHRQYIDIITIDSSDSSDSESIISISD